MTPRELFQIHVARFLSQYLPNLEYLGRVVEEGLLKDSDPDQVQQHAQRLKEYMIEAGTREDDPYLLQFGILVPGLQRGIRPPLAALGPKRGGFSKQRLEEAAGAVRRIREALSIANRLIGPLNTHTATACSDLIATIRKSVVAQLDWIAGHNGLTPDETEALVASAITLLDRQEDAERTIAGEILSCLANFRLEGLGQSAGPVVDRGIINPPTIYRDAPDAIANRLVELIPEAKGRALNDSLLALAWTRGAVAQQAFSNWKRNPQPWAAGLRIPVEGYTPDAGWTFDPQGDRRDLISLSSFQIVPRETGEASSPSLRCRISTGESCPGCKHALGWLFDFSGVADLFWSPDRAAAPRRVLFCPACACVTTIYSRYRPDGSSEWHPVNELNASDGEGDWPLRECMLLAASRPPFAGQSSSGREESWLGGAPGWLDDTFYPACPDCQNTMKFLAQFDNGTGSQPEAGIYYSFFCEACRVSAVTYQQT
jgi:hypothetical protein